MGFKNERRKFRENALFQKITNFLKMVPKFSGNFRDKKIINFRKNESRNFRDSLFKQF